jgi:hypothetical protein
MLECNYKVVSIGSLVPGAADIAPAAISLLGMQTKIEYNLHDCHLNPTLPQRDLRLKYLNNSLRATQSCDFVILKQFRSVLIHLFLLFTYLSTFCMRL